MIGTVRPMQHAVLLELFVPPSILIVDDQI